MEVVLNKMPRLLAGVLLFASALHPAELPVALNRSWLVTSMLQGSQLANRNVFDIAFESDPGSRSLKGLWVASSDGLHHYDGYRWRRYGKADGLPSNFVRCVLITHGGKLWVGTAEGAGVFDGKTFARLGSQVGLAGQNVRRISEDANGDLWFSSDTWPKKEGTGGLTLLHNGRWQRWHASDGLPSEYVVNVFRTSAGRRFVATAEGIAELKGNRFTLPLKGLARPGLNWGSVSFAESPAIGLMVSTGRDLFILNGDVWRAFRDTLPHEHGIVATADGKILACGSSGLDEKVFVQWTGSRWLPVSAPFSTTHDHIENLREAPDGSIYAVGFDSLQRWQRAGSEWTFYPQTPKPVLLDKAGFVWAMDDRGFFRVHGPNWQRLGAPRSNILESSGDIWIWDLHGLYRWPEKAASSTSEPSGWDVPLSTGIANYHGVLLDKAGNPWAFGSDAAGKQRLVHLNGNTWSVVNIPQADWIIAVPDPNSGIWCLALPTKGRGQLLKVDRSLTTFAVPDEIISKYANALHVDQSGNVWLLGETGLHRLRKSPSAGWDTISSLPGASVVGCLEKGDTLWFIIDGTLGGRSGLASFSRGSWKTFDVDPIFSWSMARNGNLLFGSKGRFYVVPATGQQAPVSVRLPEREPVIGILQDESAHYWLGTPKGTFLFLPSRIPSDTIVLFSDHDVIEGSSFQSRVRGAKFFQPPAASLGFSYSWRIDNNSWSPFLPQAERTFNSHALSLGTHHLLVRVRDNEMNVDPTPADIVFRVLALPIQERRWFWPAVVAVGLALSALTASTTVSHSRLSQQAAKLEQMVEARTAELKLAGEELRETNRALHRTNEDLRQFSWAASHDLQEPIRMVVTYTQFLAKRYAGQLDETGRQFITYAVDGAFRTQSLLQALLEYWQIGETSEASSLLPTDSAAALQKALQNLHLVLEESKAVVHCGNLPTVVQINEVALVQIFQNLISNAVKYAKRGEIPRIDITAEPVFNFGWHFRVKDNGIGIAPEHRELVFKLFKKLNGVRSSGAGVGLALCAKIVDSAGGRIWVDSDLAVGSTFHFTLPDNS